MQQLRKKDSDQTGVTSLMAAVHQLLCFIMNKHESSNKCKPPSVARLIGLCCSVPDSIIRESPFVVSQAIRYVRLLPKGQERKVLC